jgi:ArsR family transcriptional regulator, lead/cadmium/zinc/bismuth-responsive transcriptional repressor
MSMRSDRAPGGSAAGSSLAPQPIDPLAVAAARAAMPSDELVRLVVQAFGALADPTRARMLYALIGQPLCVRDLAIVAGVSESAVSHQLRLLRDRQIVKGRREGNMIVYSVENHHLAAMIREAEYYADHVRSGALDHEYPLP